MGAMMSTFAKRGDPRTIEWEARGLAWLGAAGGAQVVQVLDWGRDELVEERLTQRAVTEQAAEQFGQALWLTHRAGASAFGVGPDGWDDTTPGWIGRSRLPLGAHESWGDFYAELRLLPHARAALAAGSLTTKAMDDIERVCQRLRDGEFDDNSPVARIHGDLWGGNLLATERGLVMIDPAAHGGHGETDLAMLDLFGYPQLPRIQHAYAEAANLDADWQQRTGLHQLHPLLVHAELFGSGYGQRAGRVAARYA